jgi:hypothetical protein
MGRAVQATIPGLRSLSGQYVRSTPRPYPDDDPAKTSGITELQRQEALLKTGALQKAIFNSANFRALPPMRRA